MTRSAQSVNPELYGERSGKDLALAHRVNDIDRRAATSYSTAGAATLTAALLKSGRLVRNPNGGAVTDTTDTAANLISGLGLTSDCDQVECYIYNSADAAETITLAAGSGVTFKTHEGNTDLIIDQNDWARLLITRISASEVQILVDKYE